MIGKTAQSPPPAQTQYVDFVTQLDHLYNDDAALHTDNENYQGDDGSNKYTVQNKVAIGAPSSFSGMHITAWNCPAPSAPEEGNYIGKH